MRQLRWIFAAAIAVAAGLSLLWWVQAGQQDRDTAENADSNRAAATTRELNLAWGAKVFCSTVFVSQLPPDEAMAHSVYPIISIFPEAFKEGEITRVEVDRERKRVTLGAEGLARTAAYYGDQGCALHPRDHDGIHFDPVAVASALPADDPRPWPAGRSVDPAAADSPLDPETLTAALDAGFRPGSHTAAMVVVHGGRIVAERYGGGADSDTLLVSWSMGKSLTATLLGVLFEQGEFDDLYAPAPVPLWQRADDPRGAIRIADLLRMSSGLKFSHLQDPRESWERGHPDHMYVYSGAIDVFDFVVSRPLEFPPNTVGRYRNTDPLTLGSIIRRTVEARGQNYFTFPQSDLFDRIGIRKLVLEPDPYGNFVMTGFEYGRARDWARLGLLHLRDGLWQGERILPEGWTAFVSSPAPAWDRPEYGGLFWLNRTGNWSLPEDAYHMSGGGGQYTIIVPSLDLVVVRMGHFKGGLAPAGGGPSPAQASLDDALAILRRALEGGG